MRRSHSGGLRQYVSKVHTAEFISDGRLFHCAKLPRRSDVARQSQEWLSEIAATRTFPYCRHAPSSDTKTKNTRKRAPSHRTHALIKTQPYVTNCERARVSAHDTFRCMLCHRCRPMRKVVGSAICVKSKIQG